VPLVDVKPSSDTATINGKTYVVNDVLSPWQGRKDEGEQERSQYLNQVKINRCFAAGKQNLQINVRDGRVLEIRHRGNVELVQSNILDQYLNTVIGRLGSADYKTNFITLSDSAVEDDIAKMMNLGYSWGWDNEWMGDEKVESLIRLLAIDGFAGVRCRYDRRKGEIIGDYPVKNGVPITDEEEARDYVAEMVKKNQVAEFKSIREGKVVWELLSIFNLLWPPGFDDPKLLPWKIIQRPVSVAEVKERYGKLADNVTEDTIENMGSLTTQYSESSEEKHKIKGKCFVYTGYEQPSEMWPKGLSVVFTDTELLDVREELPYPDHPGGARDGVTLFRWTPIPGRIPGKSFIDNGIGPQKIYNKRLTQLNAMIDRNMPKVFIEEQSLARPRTGEPMELIEVRAGSPLPKTDAGIQIGGWFMDDVKLQVEAAERALGIRGVTMGQAPQGVSAYSAMALLTENDSLKLDPVSQQLRIGLMDVSWDTMEAMRNWPADKTILIAGPNDNLQQFFYQANQVPYRYLVKQPRGGSMPRTQASEIQKINDIWLAAKGQLPLSWYVESLNAGKPQELPPSAADADAHKAELENILMAETLQVPPVAPYDNDEKHVETHTAQQIQYQVMADQGDEHAQMVVEVIEAHKKEHEANAASKKQSAPMQPQAGPDQQVFSPAPPQPGGANVVPAPGTPPNVT